VQRSPSLVELGPLSLVILAEAAWLSALAALIQALSGRPTVLGIVPFAVFVGAGTLAALLLARRLGRRWPLVVPAFVAVAVVVGTLSSTDARAALGVGLGPVVSAHPAGWLAGVAVLRGVAHARLPVPEDSIARLLAVGVPGLALIAIAGTAVVPLYRAAFQAELLAAVLVFVVAATVALALTRLTDIGHDGGFDWRRNPAWIGLVLVVLAVAITATVALTTVGASLIQVLAGVTVGVLVIVALSAGLERGALKLAIGLIVFQLAIYLLVAGLRPGGPVPELPASESGTGGETDASRVLTLGVGGVVLLAAVVAIVVLATIWMRRTRTPIEDPVHESRTIDRGALTDTPAAGRRRNRRRRREPHDASAAYVALMADLDRHPSVRRAAAETPAEHASRLRAEERAGLMLDLLAADYALVRYGGKDLSAREHQRALGRWRSLRRRLTRERT
jgi:hypothetical protein